MVEGDFERRGRCHPSLSICMDVHH